MTTMIAEVYDALVSAGADEQKARRAAEALAAHESRFAAIETRLAVLTVMVGGLYAVGAPALWLLFRVAVKVGAVG